MKKIFILLISMFLLVGCIESLVTLGGGAANKKVFQSSLQSGVSYGIKKTTGKTPIGHALNYVKKNNTPKKKGPCSSFVEKKDIEICLMVEKKIISKQIELKKKSFNTPSKDLSLSIQSSINKKSKIKYLDQ